MSFYYLRLHRAVLLAILLVAALVFVDISVDVKRSERVLWSGTMEEDPAIGVGFGLEVDDGGWAYITDAASGTITSVSPEGSVSEVKATDTLPSHPVALGRWFFLYCAEEDTIVRYSIDDIRAGARPRPYETMNLTDALSTALAAAEDVAPRVLPPDDALTDLRRMDAAGDDHLFLSADIVSDAYIYRVALKWRPEDSLEELTAAATWIYGAVTEEGDHGWEEFAPERVEVERPVLDACPAAVLRNDGGPVRWRVECLHEERSFSWEGVQPVRPELVGFAPRGDLWLAERRPLPRAGVAITGFSSEWVFYWVSPDGQTRETVRVPWLREQRGGPAARSLGDSLYILYPSEEAYGLTLHVVEFARRVRVGFLERGF